MSQPCFFTQLSEAGYILYYSSFCVSIGMSDLATSWKVGYLEHLQHCI